MIFKNTFKLIFTNFNLTYKVLLYKLVILLLALGVAGTIGAPFILHLKNIDFFQYVLTQLTSLFENVNIIKIFSLFQDIFFKIIEIFRSLNQSLLINASLSLLAFILIYGLIGDFCELAVIDCLNANMTSKTKLSFFKSLVAKSLKSLGKTIIKFAFSIPYMFIFGVILYYGFTYYGAFGEISKLIIPAAMFLLTVIVLGFYLSMISGFSASIIINNEGLFKDLNTGFRTSSKKYLRLLSTSIMMSFILIFANVLIAIYTFFAGLIFTLPITYLIVSIFKIIAYYESNGMRYYVGDNIRTPLKKEEQDRIKKIKYIV